MDVGSHQYMYSPRARRFRSSISRVCNPTIHVYYLLLSCSYEWRWVTRTALRTEFRTEIRNNRTRFPNNNKQARDGAGYWRVHAIQRFAIAWRNQIPHRRLLHTRSPLNTLPDELANRIIDMQLTSRFGVVTDQVDSCDIIKGKKHKNDEKCQIDRFPPAPWLWV